MAETKRPRKHEADTARRNRGAPVRRSSASKRYAALQKKKKAS